MSTSVGPETPTDPSTRRSRRGVWVGGGIALVAVLAVAAYLFQPWTILTKTTVDEALPQASAAPSDPSANSPSPASSASSATASESPASSTPTPVPAGPKTLGAGSFRSYEHDTSGTAKLIKLADGRVFVRLENFSTSNGPDVKVWLSAAKVDKAETAKDAGYLNLGDLKANNGNQNYPIPPDTDVSKYKSVVIWCDRFSVAFGAASVTT